MGELFTDYILDVPSLQVTLTPRYCRTGQGQDESSPSSLHVSMIIKTKPGRFGPTMPLLTLPLNRGPTETVRYDGEAISATNVSGTALSLRYEDEPEGTDKIRKWYLDETLMEKQVIVQFLAPPRKTDKYTPTGPRIDLRTDLNGGLIGMGEGFIPIIPDYCQTKIGETSEEWDVEILWDLRDSPPGTRGACSLGDALYNKSRGTLDSTITHAIFAVGQLKRYPDWDVPREKSTGQREFGMYWFGEPYLDMATLPASTQVIFNAIASFFSSPNPFRVFLREVHTIYGGTGATDSYLLEYSQGAASEITDESMAELLAHETIHEYALLRPTASIPDGQQEYEDAWYVEGIANYYGAIATHQGGATTHAQLIKTLNGYGQAYYTSPTINMNYGEALKRTWENIHITRISYQRGFIYLAAENARIQAATNGKKSIDDVALALYRRRLAKQTHDIAQYRSMVAGIIGKEEEEKNYSAMYRGDIIVPASDCLASLGLKLVRCDAEKFELGFDSRALGREHVIKALVKGSRAAQAGVREGDEVLESWMAWGAADKLDGMMRVKVRRGDQVQQIEWWPRSFEKVECYKWVEA